MPELPEVETVRRGLASLLVGKTITAVEVRYVPMVTTGADVFCQALVGQTVERVARRGKYLLLHLSDCVIVSHLRMEGKYLLFSGEVPVNKHAHVFFTLSTGETLVYQDVRKFGTMALLTAEACDAYFVAKKLGPEPTAEAFRLAAFQKHLARANKAIKPLLLDQRAVAGLGNIYVDEVLWAAKVHPARPANQLTAAEIKRIRAETIRILALAVEKGGSTIRSYRNALGDDGTMQQHLQVYGQAGQPCPRCHTPIVKIQLAGRGSHFCPKCQKN